MSFKTYIINDNDIETSNENKLAYASEDGEPVLVRLNDEQLYPGGGGGGDFSTVYDGNATTTEDEDGINVGEITASLANPETIRVTFNGVVYNCVGDNGIYGASMAGGDFDFSTYPFAIKINGEDSLYIVTQTAGTFAIKIEEPSSVNDITIIPITFVNNTGGNAILYVPFVTAGNSEYTSAEIGLLSGATRIENVIFYKNEVYLLESGISYSVSGGDGVYDSEESTLTATLPCVVTLS